MRYVYVPKWDVNMVKALCSITLEFTHRNVDFDEPGEKTYQFSHDYELSSDMKIPMIGANSLMHNM